MSGSGSGTSGDTAVPYLHILAGNDVVVKEKIREKIVSRVAQHNPDFSVERFDMSRTSLDLFCQAMLSPSLFQTFRVFHLRDLPFTKAAQLKPLKNVVRNMLPDMTIVIETDEGKEKELQKLYTALAISPEKMADTAYFSLRLCEKPPDYQLPQWLVAQVPQLLGRTIAKDAADLLVELIGADLGLIHAELQKLDIHLAEGAPIDQKAVKVIVGATRNATPFELAQAVGQKNFPAVSVILGKLFSDNAYGPLITGTLFRHFWKLFRIRCFAEVNKEKANSFFKTQYSKQLQIAKEIGVETGIMQPSDSEKKAYPIMVLSGIMKQSVTFETEQLLRIFHWIAQFDTGIKNGTVKVDRQSFERLCYSIVHVDQIQQKDIV